jgi:sulfur-oxidizing protein SoxY
MPSDSDSQHVSNRRRRLLVAGVLHSLGGAGFAQGQAPTHPAGGNQQPAPWNSPSALPGVPVPVARPARPKAAFEATSVAAAQAALGAGALLPGQSVIRLDVPDIATAVGAVAVRVTPELAGVTQVAVLVHRGTFPLAAVMRPDGARAPYEITVYLDRTNRVTALVEADGKWYTVSREIKLAAQSW